MNLFLIGVDVNLFDAMHRLICYRINCFPSIDPELAKQPLSAARKPVDIEYNDKRQVVVLNRK